MYIGLQTQAYSLSIDYLTTVDGVAAGKTRRLPILFSASERHSQCSFSHSQNKQASTYSQTRMEPTPLGYWLFVPL